MVWIINDDVNDHESNETRIRYSALKEVLDFIVQHEYQRTACATENVRERALEEGTTTFRLVNGGPAM